MAEDEVTIDTNVFVHLLNPLNNTDDHIDQLLSSLVEKQITLCVDNKGRMEGEYETHVVPLFQAASDQDLRMFWLRYFMDDGHKQLVPLRFGDALMVSIRRQIRFAEPSDHVFVYVAISSNTLLVSNNSKHITDHRAALRKCARTHGSKSTDFVSSQKAVRAFGS
jgi:hypothetical protein